MMEMPEQQKPGHVRWATAEMISESLRANAQSNWARAWVNLGICIVALVALLLHAFGGGCA